jgi:transcriptional regulator with XRE-family HTH domain
VFGPELRRLREARGLSLAVLAERVHYDKGHLSKIENGRRNPTAVLARACDDALGADGLLAGLADAPTWPGRGGAARVPEPGEADDLSGTGQHHELLAGPSVLVLGQTWLRAPAGSDTLNEAVTRQFAEQLGLLRRMGQQLPAGPLLRLAAENTRTLRTLAALGGPPGPVLALAARFAEYAGWLAQESGDPGGAYRWTADAVRLAGEAGDRSLDGYALVRYAELALYQGQPDRVVGLADLVARHPGAPARTRAHAAHRRAQGHALAGDARACDAALEEGARLLAEAGGEPSSTVLGPSTALDLDALVAGWCNYDLGRYPRAVALLEPVAGRLTDSPLRLPTLFGARLALAYLETGDLDRACAVGELALAGALATGSASAFSQLAELARRLRRWHRYTEARAMQLALLTALAGRPASS